MEKQFKEINTQSNNPSQTISKYKWNRKIRDAQYEFFKDYLAYLPMSFMNEMYQHALKVFNNELIDATSMKDPAFYKSKTWKKLRFRVLNKYGRKCEICGKTSKESKLHVDHKRPRWLYPELSLEMENLRVLCEECNLGKGSRVPTSKHVWRRTVLNKLKSGSGEVTLKKPPTDSP